MVLEASISTQCRAREGEAQLFNEEPIDTTHKPPLTFDDTLGEYISLVDPISLPTFDFLPSTDAMALIERRGKSCNIPTSNGLILYELEEAINITTADAAEDIWAGESDCAADAILEERVVMKRQTAKWLAPDLIDLGSDSSDDECAIVYSILGIGVKRSGSSTHSPVKSTTTLVVKREPTSPRCPYSPSVWGDFIDPANALKKHERQIKKELVYIPRTTCTSAAEDCSAMATSKVLPWIQLVH